MHRLITVIATLATVSSLASGQQANAGGTTAFAHTAVPSSLFGLLQDKDPDAFVIDVQSGPDFWQVTGVSANDTLNIRSGPGTLNRVIARAPNGAVLRNLGCQGSGNSRWCRVETRDGAIRGWVKGSFLREYSGGGSSGGSSSADVPELVTRSTGEIEVRWGSGCTMLYNSLGNRIQAGGSCTRAQRSRSDDAVTRHMREQSGSTAEGGGGGAPLKMSGLGRVTQGGLLSGRITSGNGRSYALILTAVQDGFTCTGSFDEAPGSRSSMSTIIHCTNGASGTAILHDQVLTFSAGGKGGYVHF
ncbi:SH3 domain-containing protein [Defluviimonas sp. SAOS-178_SWC]|uniref:SH3 domain-containing protein n=1 Tax=Defluviimonas sp. SAOS-178_SWC TaxID=3121287 RepID=UPI0032214057